MRTLLKNQALRLELIPGAVLSATLLDGGGYATLTLDKFERDGGLISSSTSATGIAVIGPFTRLVTVNVQTRGTVVLDMVPSPAVPAGLLVPITSTGSVRVRMKAPETKFSIIVLYQWDQWDNKYPLGFMVCNMDRRVVKQHTLEPDAVKVSWEEGGRHYAQSVTGIPSVVGTLVYPVQLGAPLSVEILQ